MERAIWKAAIERALDIPTQIEQVVKVEATLQTYVPPPSHGGQPSQFLEVTFTHDDGTRTSVI